MLKAIQSKLGKLKKTETVVRDEDGRVFLESRDEQNDISKTLVGRGTPFVVDNQPDLQVGQVLPGLILGSQDAAADFNLLEKYSVSHILCLGVDLDIKPPPKVTRKCIRVYDFPWSQITDVFPECFDFIHSGRVYGTCVLVHCNAGVSRSATVVIAYLMLTEKWSYDDSFNHVKECRPQIWPNEGFVKQLKEYEKKLNAERAKLLGKQN